MIQQNELRIGNWVQSPFGDFAKVKQLGHPHIFGYIYAFGENYFGQGQFEGIPLTPEILQKCGFRWRYYEYIKEIGQSYNKGFTSFSYKKGVFTYEKAFEDGESKDWDKFRIKIDYLHQLQNLIYFLTGEELNIQL